MNVSLVFCSSCLTLAACGAEPAAVDAPTNDARATVDGNRVVDGPGPTACSGLNLKYSSQPTAVTATEINRNNTSLHALLINGNLNGDPDRLTIEAFFRFGVTTGTFTTWDSSSTWLFNVIADGTSTRQLYTKSGTFVVSSVTGTFAATTSNMVLVDNRTSPTCFVNLPDMTINVPITQP